MAVTYHAMLVIAEDGAKATVESGKHATADAAIAALAKLVAQLYPKPPTEEPESKP